MSIFLFSTFFLFFLVADNASQTLHYRRYKSGKSIASTVLSTGDGDDRGGGQALAFVKADLHNLLIDQFAAQAGGGGGATIRLDTRIVSYHDAPDELDGPLPQGKPYALTARGDKLYADCIVATEAPVARMHVLAALAAAGGGDAPADIDTKWAVTTGSVDAVDLAGGAASALLDMGDCADVWVGEEAYVASLCVGGEYVFAAYDLDALDEGALALDELVAGWYPPLAAAITPAPTTTTTTMTTTRLSIRQKPSSLVSRKSRKMLLFGDAAFTFPPHSPLLAASNFHAEAASTLAVCLRKAASVPLALEVYSRLRAPRYASAMLAAQARFNAVTASAQDAELEASDLLWQPAPDEAEGGGGARDGSSDGDGKGGWFDYDAEKFAEKNFDGVIDQLTAELLGKQKAMMEAQAEAQAKAQAEAQAKAQAEAPAEAQAEAPAVAPAEGAQDTAGAEAGEGRDPKEENGQDGHGDGGEGSTRGDRTEEEMQR